MWPGAAPSDRRRARGWATRDALLRATADLVDGGDLRPTSDQVARKAGVSRRLVFHHFDDVDSLLVDTIESQLARHRAVIVPVPAHGARHVRIGAVCKQRRVLFERVRPLLMAAGWLREGARAPDRAARPARPVQLAGLREQLAQTFAPELEGLGEAAPEVLDWLDLLTGWEHWQTLRSRMRLTATAAERTTAELVRRVLSGA